MNNKLSELRKPVGFVSDRASTQLKEGYPASIRPFFDVQGSSPLYSQEYVSALLAELESSQLALKNVTELWNEQRQRIAELVEREKRVVALANGNDELWEAMAHRLKTLEDKLATPVRLPQKNIGWDRDDGEDCWNNAIDACAKELRAAGFKCVGDE